MWRDGLCNECWNAQRRRTRRPTPDFTCPECGRQGEVWVVDGVCGACYNRRRYRREIRCEACGTVGVTFAHGPTGSICNACWQRRSRDTIACPACGETKETIVVNGQCFACYLRTRRRRVDTCEQCGQTRDTSFPLARRTICNACYSTNRNRQRGIPPKEPPASAAVVERRFISQLALLRQPWVRAYLDLRLVASRAGTTRTSFLAELVRLDRYLQQATEVGEGQWSLLTAEQLDDYLLTRPRVSLDCLRPFLAWLHLRRGCRDLTEGILVDHVLPRLNCYSDEEVARYYREWTAPEGEPRRAVVGLLALLHGLNAGEIAHIRLADLRSGGQLAVGTDLIALSLEVRAALARYLDWRFGTYAGSSPYLIISHVSRLRRTPVDRGTLADLLGGVSLRKLRLAGIRHLVRDEGYSSLEVAEHARVGVQQAENYRQVFHPSGR